MALTETPMQRERARTIFEKSVPGRRAAVLPDAGAGGAFLVPLVISDLACWGTRPG